MLARVDVTRDVHFGMLAHALSTEKEEVLGLLLGSFEDSDAGLVCTVWSAAPQSRRDRRRDRVETTPEQLAAALQLANAASEATGQRTCVVGWYHSHPHITVLPSAVDVRTQASLQQLDAGFVGLIFSAFDFAVSKVGRVQVIAFQADTAHSTHRLVPLRVVPSQPHPAWPHRLAPLLQAQRCLLDEAASHAAAVPEVQMLEVRDDGASQAAAAAATAGWQSQVASLACHSLAPLLAALEGRLAQAQAQLALLDAD